MVVMILGGGGHVARVTAAILGELSCVDQIILADRDLRAAVDVAGVVGEKATVVELDLQDAEALQSHLAGVSLVVNLAGPYYRYGPAVLARAIEAGADYLDICDDWEPTEQMLTMHAAAEAAGVMAILGMGASPGISNLLAVHAMEGLDAVERVCTVWSPGNPDENMITEHTDPNNPQKASAALAHGLMQMTGLIKRWSSGEPKLLQPLQERVLNLPEIGDVAAASFGHPEPVTLPRYFDIEQETVCLMSNIEVWRAPLDRYVKPLAITDDFNYGEAADAYLAGLREYAAEVGELPEVDYSVVPPYFAAAEGRVNGERQVTVAGVTGFPDGGMAESTGVPLAVVASMLMEGGMPRRTGVWAPEAVVPVDAFMEHYAKHCVLYDDEHFLYRLAGDGSLAASTE